MCNLLGSLQEQEIANDFPVSVTLVVVTSAGTGCEIMFRTSVQSNCTSVQSNCDALTASNPNGQSLILPREVRDRFSIKLSTSCWEAVGISSVFLIRACPAGTECIACLRGFWIGRKEEQPLHLFANWPRERVTRRIQVLSSVHWWSSSLSA